MRQAALPVIQWVVTGYTLAFATAITTVASAARRFGAKRVWLFIVGSVLTGLAWDVQTLIGFRVQQGIGGGLVVRLFASLATLVHGLATPGERGEVVAADILQHPRAGRQQKGAS